MACCNGQNNYSIKGNLINMKKKEGMKCKLMKAPPPNSFSSGNNKGNNDKEDNDIPDYNKKPAASAIVTPTKPIINFNINNFDDKDKDKNE